MATSGHITRTSLSLADLAICNATYDVMYDASNLLDVGTVPQKRLTADSPWTPGRVLVQAVQDTPTMAWRIDVTGSTLATVQTNVTTLLAAVWQITYQISITLDTGATYTWQCEPADVSVGFNFEHVRGLACPVVLSIPRNPIPVAGPI